jgi:hypothetical protein
VQYLLLIYQNEKAWEDMPQDEQNKFFGEYMQLSQDLKSSGKSKGGEALQPIRTATTVRVRNGKVQTTDGPFAETREQLGGFYLIEAADLDEATKIAARIPDARIGDGSVEIRPVMVFNK